jgi:hypothetical protein
MSNGITRLAHAPRMRSSKCYRAWRDDRPASSETKVFVCTSAFRFAVVGITATLLAAYAEARGNISREDGPRYAVFLGPPTSSLAA